MTEKKKQQNVELPENVAPPTKQKYQGTLATSGGGGKVSMESRLCDAIEAGANDDKKLYKVFYDIRKDTSYQSDEDAFRRYMKCGKMRAMMRNRGLI